MDTEKLTAFVLITVVLVITPGADTLLVLRSAIAGGRGNGVAVTRGIVAGLLVHATLAVCGISALLLARPSAFTLVKQLGAAYLCVLGLTALWAAVRGPRDREEPAVGVGTPGRRAFAHGLMTNLLNPKAVLFYLAFIPQFAPRDASGPAWVAGLGAIHLGMSIVWLLLVAHLAGSLGAAISRGPVRRALDAAAGVAFLAFGARLAAMQR